MTRPLQALLTAVCCCLVIPLFAQPKHLDKYVNRLAYEQLDFKKTPGIIIGVIEGDSTYYWAYGETKRGDSISPTPQTIFEIGSVTKVFTATVLQLMQEKDQVTLNQSIQEYFNLPTLQNEGEHISLQHLVAHASGLPKLPFNFGQKELDIRDPYAFYTINDLMTFLAEYYPKDKPGSTYRYSHVGYALLSAILEKAANQDLTTLYETYLIEPLSLNNTVLSLTEQQQAQLAQGYALSGVEVDPWSAQCFAGALGLKSSAEDLVKVLRLNMQASLEESNTLKAMHQPLIETDRKRVYAGMGWHLIKMKKGNNLVAHSGVTDGHRAFIGFVDNSRSGVVVLSNSEHNQNGVGLLLLEYLNRRPAK